MVTWGHLYVMLNQPAIEPPGECVSNIDLFRRLAKTMGFDDDYWSHSLDEMLMRSYDWTSPVMQGITLEALKEKGWMRLNVGLEQPALQLGMPVVDALGHALGVVVINIDLNGMFALLAVQGIVILAKADAAKVVLSTGRPA
eukprot:gene1209-1689_t